MNKNRINAPENLSVLPINKFYISLHSKLRCSKRNSKVSEFLSKFLQNVPQRPSNRRSQSTTDPKRSEVFQSVTPSDLFMWFIIKKNKMRDLIPDMEFIKYQEICSEMISVLGNCCEAHFGLGKMFAHEGNFDFALQHLRICLSESKNDSLYNIWNAVITVFRVNSKKRALQAKKICNILLKSDHKNIEVLWALMQLSQSEYLKIDMEIENPYYFASKIYYIDKYYGALAWSEIFLNGVNAEKGENLLKVLIMTHKKRPEAYLKLWSYYYHVVKNYELSLKISEKAFVAIKSSSDYSVILSINYARSLFKSGKIKNCLELLQMEYTKHSLFTVILYHYGRFCIKSKEPFFLGSAIGALEESLKTSSEARHGSIYYWLVKAYLQAEEKLEAFECAKKAIPIISNSLDKLETSDRETEKKLFSKLNELKDIMKDLHIHLISISMLEKLLEEPMLNVNECKLYCVSIKEFDRLEGHLYEAKMWWKAGNLQKAKEILFSELQNTRVKMKAYFLLIDLFQSEANFEEMLALSKEMVKKCRSPIIPVQTWLEANMIYAKCLIKHSKIQEALLIYKSLAQVQPIPFIPDVNYTRELQRACNKEEFNNVLLKVNEKKLRYSYLSSSSSDFQVQQLRLVSSKQNMTSVLLGEDDDELDLGLEVDQTFSTERSDSLGNRAPEPLQKIKLSSIPSGTSANIGFSVTTSYLFLYKIGKTCAKFCVNASEGLHALHDFLNMHHYWTKPGFKVHEKINVKAKFWLGILYFHSGLYASGEEVFKDILSMLFQMGMTKMSSEVLRLLNSNKV